ncbi:hypothetical protein Rleg10DRAFT_3788 [Rhizobium leguminosarum bv. trifolii WSM2012]|nr:hypothetical protein Rleg10DRAFT_3788 [Rhizobium leguminosarum bv. trifolii WSM2012]
MQIPAVDRKNVAMPEVQHFSRFAKHALAPFDTNVDLTINV